ncbi:MAG: MBL fold metallo-hydrolase [Candidatus Latescibacterota bacterium]
MYQQLEDEFGDVVGKARRGLEVAVEELAADVGLPPADIARIERYELIPDPPAIARLAERLELHPARLEAASRRAFFPAWPHGRTVEGLTVEMMVLGRGFPMNGYVVACPETRQGAVIDPGAEPETILKVIEAGQIEVRQVLLTHGHGDHIGALSEICQAVEAPAFISKGDIEMLGPLATKIEGAIVDGETIPLGNQVLVARHTPGHTAGGTCFVHRSAAFVGDALFAGSMGGARRRSDYDQQRRTVREHVLALGGHVVVYPGHGPATTVAEERQHNPVFP